MAVIHDVMPAFELFQPASQRRVGILKRYGPTPGHGGGWTLRLAEGSHQTSERRGRSSQVEELQGIKERNGGLEIGVGTTLTDIVRHPVVRDKFGLLTEAAELVASPQIRNRPSAATFRGHRCWHYRAGGTCYWPAAISAMPTR
jgi:CO/xanthine dehydrogenase FAD-binding subunit